MNYSDGLEEINVIIYILKLFCISLGVYYAMLKNTNVKNNIIKNVISICIISIICGIVKYMSNSMNSIMCLVLLLSINFSRFTENNIGYYILITTIYVSINYLLFLCAVAITYLPNRIINIKSNGISFILIIIMYFVLIFIFFKIKKFKKGFDFLREKLINEYFNILILNLSSIILFLIVVLSNYEMKITGRFGVGLIFFSVLMFITIQKSLQMYYKQKLLIQELNETKEELKQKKLEIQELEKENLNFSKISHSIAHKQKSLEYKLNELMLKSEIASEIEIKDRLKNMNGEIQQVTVVKLQETNISEIDDMLSYMQSECSKNRIDFQIQLSGNIYYMTNNYIDKEKLEILLADHIKNAIIAINHTETNNRSILLRLGMIEGIYSVYVYDSGIEFEVETLANLGEKPTTTHVDRGGTGMGFMNTFDTLKQYQASMIICEYGRPCQDNFTKCIQIKFDKKNEFRIRSYRANELQNAINKKEVQIEKIDSSFQSNSKTEKV